MGSLDIVKLQNDKWTYWLLRSASWPSQTAGVVENEVTTSKTMMNL